MSWLPAELEQVSAALPFLLTTPKARALVPSPLCIVIPTFPRQARQHKTLTAELCVFSK